jgi:hypothetical protein
MVSGISDALRGIWGSSGSDVFAVGYEGIILHYMQSTATTTTASTSIGPTTTTTVPITTTISTGTTTSTANGTTTTIIDVTTTTTTDGTTTTIPSDTTTTTISNSTTTTTTINGGGRPCLAETIYGENSEETELLKNYRNEVLSKTTIGLKIIKTYYKFSPTVTKLLEQMPLIKSKAKSFIDSMLPGIRKKVEEK